MRKLIVVAMALAVVAAAPVAAQGVLFVVNDSVGIGTNSPTAPFHLFGAPATFKVEYDGVASVNFAVTNTGVFTVNKSGTGGQEFTVRDRNDPVATLDVQGHVRGTSFKSTSSRAMKTGFEIVDATQVLASVAELPITAWRYKTEDESVRHIGPVAEDFQRLFSLGDGKTIGTVDADGIALAAIKGLYQELQARDAEIDSLRSELQELRALIESR